MNKILAIKQKLIAEFEKQPEIYGHLINFIMVSGTDDPNELWLSFRGYFYIFDISLSRSANDLHVSSELGRSLRTHSVNRVVKYCLDKIDDLRFLRIHNLRLEK